jgi:phage baseplate assembly protein V
MSEASIVHRRVMNMVSRGVVAETNDDPGVQNVQVSLMFDEAKVAVERLQNYGFSGHAPVDSEVVVVFIGGGRDHGVIIGTDSRNSRMTGLAEGEVAVYTDEGDSIVLRRDNTVEVTTKKLIIKAEDEVTIETKRAVVKASEKATIEAPDILLKGNVEIDGTLTQAQGGGDSAFNIKGNINLDGNIAATKTITADTINAPHGHVGP